MTIPGPDANLLALERTRLALERTLMAWIRTAVSLISFGFAIFKFSEYLRVIRPEPHTATPIGPHLFANLMIVVGLIALALAWLQHRQAMATMRQAGGAMPYSLAGVIAVLVAGLGIVALMAVSLRW